MWSEGGFGGKIPRKRTENKSTARECVKLPEKYM